MKKQHRASDDIQITSEISSNTKNNAQNTILNILIVICLIVVGVLAGYIFFPNLFKKNTTTSTAPKLTEHTFESLNMKANIPKAGASVAHTFLTKVVQKDLIPREISLVEDAESKVGDQGKAHVGGWNKDGKFLSLLYSTSPNPDKPSYLRAWYMTPGATTTNAEAQKLIGEIFDTAFVSLVGLPECQQIKEATGTTLTECAKMKTTEDGSLWGLTVRAPIVLEPPPGQPTPAGAGTGPKVIVASACFIPKEGTPFYRSSSCI